jgi:hypothetical protein
MVVTRTERPILILAPSALRSREETSRFLRGEDDHRSRHEDVGLWRMGYTLRPRGTAL